MSADGTCSGAKANGRSSGDCCCFDEDHEKPHPVPVAVYVQLLGLSA